MSFSTTDGRPLEMEARHKLPQAIDARCCRAVDVEIVNRDRYPGTVRLELNLRDSSRFRDAPVTLGAAPVLSRPASEEAASSETLSFTIPPGPQRLFDEFQVIFERDASRADKSARISIQRFVLRR